jgi:hypothetical protein
MQHQLFTLLLCRDFWSRFEISGLDGIDSWGPMPELSQQVTGTWKHSCSRTQVIRIFWRVKNWAESNIGFEETSAKRSAGFEERRNKQLILKFKGFRSGVSGGSFNRGFDAGSGGSQIRTFISDVLSSFSRVWMFCDIVPLQDEDIMNPTAHWSSILVLKYWSPEILKYWSPEILKSWSTEVLKYWSPEVLKS